MSLFINKEIRAIVQGISEETYALPLEQSLLREGTFVGAVGFSIHGAHKLKLPTFDTIMHAKEVSKCNTIVIVEPPSSACQAILDAESAGIELIICMTKNIPIHDMLKVSDVMRRSKTSRLIGPGSSGFITEKYKVGLVPRTIFKKGDVGIVSRSWTLSCEAISQMRQSGIGFSACVDVGEGLCSRTRIVDIIRDFQRDPQIKTILLLGQAEGTQEEEAATWIMGHATKPVVAYVAGKNLKSCQESHLVETDVQKKILALRLARAKVVINPAAIGAALFEEEVR